jgi:glycosyltransferase involved in cell wall biosynthesis
MTAIGYLVSQYPAASHTFIRREVAALRGGGLTIRTYSVRPGDASPDDAAARAEAATTFEVLKQTPGAFVAAHFHSLVTGPLRYLSTMRLALRHRVPGLRAFVRSLFYFAEAILLARQLRRDGVTRLHSHFANPGATVGVLATHHLRLPWSVTLHGISEFDYPAGLLLAAKLERCEFAACVSYFGMAQAMRLTRPAIWPRLKLVRCGIDPSDLPGVRARPPGSLFELICVGRLSPEKGHAGLLTVLAGLLEKGVRIQLTLVGDGPEAEALKALAGDLGITGHVKFAGRLDEAGTLAAIAGSDALVLASFMEGLPIVLMEAMALGVPVVASRVAGIPELVADGETGLLFEPANWAQLGQALERLCNDAEMRGHLATRARARVLEEFTYPKAAEPLVELFERPPND